MIAVRARWYTSMVTPKLVTTRGKKIKPERTKIVVLDMKESGLLRRKRRRAPLYFQGADVRRDDEQQLSILEGVDLDRRLKNDSQTSVSPADEEESSGNILREIESQRQKLMVFKSTVSMDQATKSINHQKPVNKTISSKRYEQLQQLLDTAYTLPQLRAYTKFFYNRSHSRTKKHTLIKTILQKYWECKVSETISDSQDLILERTIDISRRDMFLLLLTNNGKILQNLARIGATLAVALDENKIIVRATAPIIKYVEVSLTKILQNVNSQELSLTDIIRNHTPTGNKLMQEDKIEKLVSLVQKESATFFEAQDDASRSYLISAFGLKRLAEAKNLLLWGVSYKPQIVEETIDVPMNTQHTKYPFTNPEYLNWIDRSKDWYRLCTPQPKAGLPNTTKSIPLPQDKLESYYKFFTDKNVENTQNTYKLPQKFKQNQSTVFSMTYGQLLRNKQDRSDFIFQPKIPQITSRLLSLPLYHQVQTQDEVVTVDQHEYYTQLCFIPDLSTVPNKLNVPPLDMWLELDDLDNAIISSARTLLKTEQRHLLLETPHLSHDYKIETDTTCELTAPLDNPLNSDEWLRDQPGIKNFLQIAKLTFQSNKKLSIPRSINVALPFLDNANQEQTVTIKYDFVNATHHRILRLMYMNKYMVQFSDVKGGPAGGKYSQVDFIGDVGRLPEPKEFDAFIQNVLQFF